MKLTNTRISKITESATLAAKAKANELKARGVRVIDLTAGEPEVDTPDYIKEAGTKAIQEGRTKYTAVAGLMELRTALAEKLTRENGVPTTADNVIVTNGGKQALYSCLDTILEPGDEVIIPAPYWVSYPAMVMMAGGVPVIAKTTPEGGFRLTSSILKKALTPKTKCIILNSPSNPTGVGYTASELTEICEPLLAHSCLVLTDEIYERITFHGFQFSSVGKAVPALLPRTITANSFSKTFAMTGWRVGYATGPKEVISAMTRHQNQSTSNINTPSQYAAIAALKGGDEFSRSLARRYEKRIDLVVDKLKSSDAFSLPAKPNGAYYLFIRADGLMARKGLASAAEVAAYLLEKAGVCVVPGDAFGDDKAFRISVTTDEKDLLFAIDRMLDAGK